MYVKVVKTFTIQQTLASSELATRCGLIIVMLWARKATLVLVTVFEGNQRSKQHKPNRM